MEFLSVLLFACFFVWAWFHVRSIWQRRSVKYPPGPYPVPIIGNILHLSRSPHISLANLSKQYGPLMYLKLGSLDTIVVSSPEMAKQVLQKHDDVFCGRPVPLGAQAYDFHQNSIGFLPVGDKWRTLRQISKDLVLSNSQLDTSARLRQEKLRELHDYIGKCCDEGVAINIGETASMTSISLMSATIFSDDFGGFGSHSERQIAQMVQEFIEVVGAPNVADFFPVLKVIDPQGILRKAKNSYGKLLEFLQDMIDRRLVSGVIKDDLLQKLLHVCQEGHHSEYFSHKSIRFLLLDLFSAGVDTVSDAVEWAMTELLRNPEKMSKLKDELEAVIGEKSQVAESDISRLPYLHAVIKEALRCHPVAPFLIPHKTIAEIEINGYTIPNNAQVFVNIWAIGRDPSVWLNADKFEPERFIKSKMDYKGQDFEFTPFGSGRRMCFGWPLAHRMMPLILASLVHDFDWILDAGMKPNEIDMTDRFGVVLKKAIPLKGIPVKTQRQRI